MSEELKRILYVEDDEDIAELVLLALTEFADYQVLHCESGILALAALDKFKPQLILMDVMMPDMDGPTALRKIREHPDYNDIPVIFMTARVQHHELKEYYACGADDVIVKPFDPINLPQQLAKLWKLAYER